MTVPDTVTSVGDYAFARCPSLASVAINASTSANASAFPSCLGFGLGLASGAGRQLGERSGVRAGGMEAGRAASVRPAPAAVECVPCAGGGALAIPARVTSVGEFAFYGCGNITSVAFSSSVTRIGVGVRVLTAC